MQTGPLKIGDDWPGIFIRGDEAIALAQDCRVVAQLNRLDLSVVVLERIAALLESCRVD